MCVLIRSVVSDSCSPMDYSLPGSSVRGISQTKSGFSFPSAGDLPDPGIEPTFPALAGRLFTTEPPGKPWLILSLAFPYKILKQQNYVLCRNPSLILV